MSNSVDPRMHPVTDMLQRSRLAGDRSIEVRNLRRAVTELAKIVKTILPEPEPSTPTPEDLAAMEAAGIESFEDALVELFGAKVQHPTVARIKFADGGAVKRDTRQSTMTAAELEDLHERHTARISAKNATIRSLEERIFNQRRELAVLNGKQSENTQVMGWLAAIANADKDVEAGLAAGKALSEFAQTLRAA